MNKYGKSKTSLFLMELIMTVMLFSVCSAVCLKLFVNAHMLDKKTVELNNAVAIAQGFAEVMRGTDGSMDAICEIYPASVIGNDSYFEVYYDENFNQCEYSAAKYAADVTLTPDGAIQNMEVVIIRLEDYEEVYSLTATKYMNDVKG